MPDKYGQTDEYVRKFVELGKFSMLFYDTIETDNAYYFYNFDEDVQLIGEENDDDDEKKNIKAIIQIIDDD